MKALIIGLLIHQMAMMEERRVVADAPTLEAPPPPRLIMMTEDNLISIVKRVVSCEATVAKAEESFLISKPVLIGGIVGLVVVSAAVGAALAYVGAEAMKPTTR